MSVTASWAVYAHPLFLDQLRRLTELASEAHRRNPSASKASEEVKLLAQLRSLTNRIIPEDPTRPEYRQGGTLGREHKHWFRAKFGAGRYRLFFRYSTSARIIVYAWVNDSQTLRTYGSKTDAYAVFRSMLDRSNPPGSWDALLKTSQKLG
jgi:toxin YhaV